MTPHNYPTIDPARLQPNPWNSNRVSPANADKIDASIKRFAKDVPGGMFKPVIVRELEDGTLQIIGGQHRVEAAIRLKLKSIPFHNLGRIDDNKAKEIGLVDNGRYGEDDTLQLAELLEGLGDSMELASFLPYSDNDLASIFASTNIALDDIGIEDDEDLAMPSAPPAKQVQTHQIMRFRVPVDDCGWIAELVEKTMKTHALKESDALTNAGDAFVLLMKQAKDNP
jgi:ParB-like chromosome segregation protein Spo0J